MLVDVGNFNEEACYVYLHDFVHVHIYSSQESRELAESKERERSALLREHKKEEREMTKKGKTPFYVKKCKCTHNNDQ